MEHRHQSGVLLDGQDLAHLLDQHFRQRPKPRPDLQYPIRLLEVRNGQDAPHLVGVMEKVLAQRLGQLDVARRQHLLHVVEVHRARSSPNSFTAARS